MKNHPSSIRCRDLNSKHLDLQSPPITARPGLPTFWFEFFYGHEFVLVRCSCVKRKLLCKSSQTPKLVFARIRVSWKCLRRESLGTNAITIKWYYNRRFLKFLCQNCFSYNRPSPASFHIILVLYKQLTEKTVNFSWIWTRILWIEGMQDHHLTTNTSPYIKTYI